MTSEEIVARVREELNEAGSAWKLSSQVSEVVQCDGAWLQVFIKSDAKKANAAAERQIIADVEANVSDQSGQEILLVPVQELVSSAS